MHYKTELGEITDCTKNNIKKQKLATAHSPLTTSPLHHQWQQEQNLSMLQKGMASSQ